MLKPVCVTCQRFFRMRKGGFYFVEGVPVGADRPAAGTAEPDRWRPYKIWAADLYEYQGCGAQILAGFGRDPIAVQHEARLRPAADRARRGSAAGQRLLTQRRR
jgi:hypothetical protein